MVTGFRTAWIAALAGLGLAALACAAGSATTDAPPPLSRWDAADDRIDAPARAALVRLSSQSPELATEAWLILKAVKSRSLGGIHVQGGEMALFRARALGIPRTALLVEGQVARCLAEPEGARPLVVYADAVAGDPPALDAAILAGFRACPFARVYVFVTHMGDRVPGAEVVAADASQGIRTEPCRTTSLGRCQFVLPVGADYEVTAQQGDRLMTLPLPSLHADGAGLRFDLADFEPQSDR